MIKRIVKYEGHVIYYDTEFEVYLVALNKDGTDKHFSTIDEVFEVIDKKVKR